MVVFYFFHFVEVTTLTFTSDLQTVSIEWNIELFPQYYTSSFKVKTQSQNKWHEELETQD